MIKRLGFSIFAGLLLYPLCGFGQSVFSKGTIDKGLIYKDFKIGQDGYLTGYIVNTTGTTRRNVRLDVWTTTPENIKVFWQKVFDIGDMAPGAIYFVKEPYKIGGENPDRVMFMFRPSNPAEYRNKGNQNIR